LPGKVHFLQSVDLNTFHRRSTFPEELRGFSVSEMRKVPFSNIAEKIRDAAADKVSCGYILRSRTGVIAGKNRSALDFVIYSTRMKHIRDVIYESVQNMRSIQEIALAKYLESPYPNLGAGAKVVYKECKEFAHAINVIHARFGVLNERIVGFLNKSTEDQKAFRDKANPSKFDIIILYFADKGIEASQSNESFLDIIRDYTARMDLYNVYHDLFFGNTPEAVEEKAAPIKILKNPASIRTLKKIKPTLPVVAEVVAEEQVAKSDVDVDAAANAEELAAAIEHVKLVEVVAPVSTA
jgi:hypothetical protein